VAALLVVVLVVVFVVVLQGGDDGGDDGGGGGGGETPAGGPFEDGVRYAAGEGRGAADGSTWADAAPVTDLDALVTGAGPGGEVRLDAGSPLELRGNAAAVVLESGGEPGAPVTVRGVDPATDEPAPFTVSGTRPDPWVADDPTGPPFLELADGADHLVIEQLALEDVGEAITVTGGEHADLTITDVTASNIRRGLLVDAPASVAGGRFERWDIEGFSKQALRFENGSTDIAISNITADSLGQDGDDFLIGIGFSGNEAPGNSGITITNVSFTALVADYGEEYWQGDGITTEEFDHDIAITGLTVTGAYDSGVDLKSSDTTVTGCTITDAKRSIRVHPSAAPGAAVVIDGCTSTDPRYPGGAGSSAHVQANGNVVVRNSTFTGGTGPADRPFAAFDSDAAGAIEVTGSTVALPPGAELYMAERGRVTIGATTVDGAPVTVDDDLQTPTELPSVAGVAPIEERGGGGGGESPDTPGEPATADGPAGPVTVADVTAARSGRRVRVRVELAEPAPADGFTFTWSTADGTAVDGVDYVARTNEATIPAGQSRTTVTTALVAGAPAGAPRTFTVTVTPPSGPPVTATVTLID
jgi:hypothetical protein